MRKGAALVLATLGLACAPDEADGGTRSGPSGGDYGRGVTIRLQRLFEGGDAVAFGLPLPPGAVRDAATLRVSGAEGAIPGVTAKVLLRGYDATGAPKDVRAVLIVLPSRALPSGTRSIEIAWRGGKTAPAALTFEAASAPSPETATVAHRTIVAGPQGNRIVESGVETKTLFSAREPRAIALFPPGYLAATGILGEQVTAAEAQAAGSPRAGLAFLSRAAIDFGLSAMNAAPYPLHPKGVSDPASHFEAWLYDRCATFLSLYAHAGDARFLRHGLRSCAHYAGQIATSGPRRGTFLGRAEPDAKYSHLRGLFAYYALTGDETALAAGVAMAEMFLDDPAFVVPYRAGKLRGPDKLWTERLLGTSLEALIYGHRLTGEKRFLSAFREMLATAHRHVTGDPAALGLINPGVGPFPPQGCFIHSALQHAEGEADQPWCSAWMSELAVDALLRYEEQTNDPRVDELFIHLTRFVRDVGSQYVVDETLENDRFTAPKSCHSAARPRLLAPIYGAGLRADGTRFQAGESSDVEHCADATALTAAGIRALHKKGLADRIGPAPFATEGASFLQLHHELAACARETFAGWSKPRRAPSAWTSAALQPGLADPAAFIESNRIGYPTHGTSPLRKLSWWFNMSLLGYRLLAEADVRIPALTPGKIQPAGCD